MGAGSVRRLVLGGLLPVGRGNESPGVYTGLRAKDVLFLSHFTGWGYEGIMEKLSWPALNYAFAESVAVFKQMNPAPSDITK